MNKIFRKSFSLLLALLLMLGLTAPVLAAGSAVSFENGRLIAFAPGSVYTGTDLFGSFKGVMPGDSRSEQILIQNKSRDFDYIKVYMRAALHDGSGEPLSGSVLAELQSDQRRGEVSELAYMYDFLSQLSMTVSGPGGELFSASPDQLGGLADGVYLAALRQGEGIQLDVNLSVPIELGSEYADRIGEVDWVFVVEGFNEPGQPGGGTLLQTGQLKWPIPVMACLGLGLILWGLIIMLKKRKHDRA